MRFSLDRFPSNFPFTSQPGSKFVTVLYFIFIPLFKVASVMLGFNNPSSSYKCSILTASDFLGLMKKVQILPTGFREVMTLVTTLQGRQVIPYFVA